MRAQPTATLVVPALHPRLALHPRQVVKRLDLPGADRPWAYALRYWGATLTNLLRPHRLAAGSRTAYAAGVTITPQHHRQWLRLFQAQPGCPLLYNQSVGTLLYTQVFHDLGLNFRHLLHVQHGTEHIAHAEELANTPRQQLVCELQGCWRMAPGRALVALRTRVHASAEAGGALLAVLTDRFLIRHVPQADWRALPPMGDIAERGQLREPLGLRQRLPEINPRESGVLEVAMNLPADQGQRYAAVSGDHNPVHTTPLLARLFGHPRPFVQGLALRNAVMRELHQLGAPLQRLQITFAAPAFLGQTLRWLLQGRRWELLDEAGRVVAFGTAGEQVG
jgi:acyl dehydratase